MGKTILLGHILRIPVKAHWSLLAFFALIGLALVPLFQQDPRWAALQVFVFVGIFVTILLHELGHATLARRYGSEIVDIILTPIGGIARIRRMPERAMQELLVAIAGPAVNIVLLVLAILYVGSIEPMLAVIADVGAAYFDPESYPRELQPLRSLTDAIAILGGLNLIIAGFNMLPGFPMDGGRVLRAALTPRLGYENATVYAVIVGRLVAAAFGVWGLILLFEHGMFGGAILAIIAMFLWVTGAAELEAVRRRGLVRGFTARDVLAGNVPVVGPSMHAYDALNLVANRQLHGVPVVDEWGYLVGWLDHPSYLAATPPPAATVAHIMRPRVPWVRPEDPLDRTVQAIEETGILAVPVTDPDGRYHGTITIPHLQSFLMQQLQRRLPGMAGP